VEVVEHQDKGLPGGHTLDHLGALLEDAGLICPRAAGRRGPTLLQRFQPVQPAYPAGQESPRARRQPHARDQDVDQVWSKVYQRLT